MRDRNQWQFLYNFLFFILSRWVRKKHFIFSSQRPAHANSVARIANPAGITIKAGPGRTISTMPKSKTVPPITAMVLGAARDGGIDMFPVRTLALKLFLFFVRRVDVEFSRPFFWNRFVQSPVNGVYDQALKRLHLKIFGMPQRSVK